VKAFTAEALESLSCKKFVNLNLLFRYLYGTVVRSLHAASAQSVLDWNYGFGADRRGGLGVPAAGGRSGRALAMEQHESWIEATRCLNMNLLQEYRKQLLRQLEMAA
jgi:hypothetical protein